jgi:hypothetical protein
MKTPLVTDLRPYTFRQIRQGSWFGYGAYTILFDGSEVRTIDNMSQQTVQKMIFLLNGAYQLGFLDGSIE